MPSATQTTTHQLQLSRTQYTSTKYTLTEQQRSLWKMGFLLQILHFSVLVQLTTSHGNHGDESPHGNGAINGKARVMTNVCDDAKSMLWVDWDSSTDYEHQCQPDEDVIPVIETDWIVSCLDADDIPDPYHICMIRTIEYDDKPPRGGLHRPQWAVYGEYTFLPPQRWVHNLEHGALAFLYHPCANEAEVNALKTIAKSCLRKHVITPYRNLSLHQPLAIVSWGCKLTMSKVDDKTARDFIKEHALQTSERHENEDGDYNLGLLHKAHIVTNMADDKLCPTPRYYMIAENMQRND